MDKKWTPHLIAVGVFVVFIVLGLACASTPESSKEFEIVYTEVPYSELWKEVEKVNSLGKGFIVEAYFNATNAPGEGSFSIVANPTDRDGHWIRGHNNTSVSGYYHELYNSYVESHQFEQYDNQTYKRIDKNKLYKIYICVFYGPAKTVNTFDIEEVRIPIIDRIEGLRSLEEVAAIETQQKAESEAAEEAIKKAREAANKYDKSKFIIVPENFYPANYSKADLFAAVAASEKLGVSGMTPSGIDWGAPSRDFVSDVVFVSQNGTNITFRTADNAISRSMKVDSRTGLTVGQKVRIYYTVYRIKDWAIVAIERL